VNVVPVFFGLIHERQQTPSMPALLKVDRGGRKKNLSTVFWTMDCTSAALETSDLERDHRASRADEIEISLPSGSRRPVEHNFAPSLAKRTAVIAADAVVPR